MRVPDPLADTAVWVKHDKAIPVKNNLPSLYQVSDSGYLKVKLRPYNGVFTRIQMKAIVA